MRIGKPHYFRRYDVEFAHHETGVLMENFGHLRWCNMRVPRSKAKLRRKLRIVTVEEPCDIRGGKA